MSIKTLESISFLRGSPLQFLYRMGSCKWKAIDMYIKVFSLASLYGQRENNIRMAAFPNDVRALKGDKIPILMDKK